jgi:hypothetical protein
MSTYDCETTIRGGFPLIVTYNACPAERDVGIMSAYAEVDEILTPAGKSADFLKITDNEMREIEEACDEDMNARANDYYDDERY